MISVMRPRRTVPSIKVVMDRVLRRSVLTLRGSFRPRSGSEFLFSGLSFSPNPTTPTQVIFTIQYIGPTKSGATIGSSVEVVYSISGSSIAYQTVVTGNFPAAAITSLTPVLSEPVKNGLSNP